MINLQGADVLAVRRPHPEHVQPGPLHLHHLHHLLPARVPRRSVGHLGSGRHRAEVVVRSLTSSLRDHNAYMRAAAG